MIRPASKNTGIAITSPVIPRAQAAFLSPNLFTMVTARVWAPPEISRIAPNMDPRPTSRAIPLSVFPIPSLTELIISSKDIPEISPIAMAPARMAIIAWILNLMIRTSRITSPTKAAVTSLTGLAAAASIYNIHTLLQKFFLFLIPYIRPSWAIPHVRNRFWARLWYTWESWASRPFSSPQESCQSLPREAPVPSLPQFPEHAPECQSGSGRPPPQGR